MHRGSTSLCIFLSLLCLSVSPSSQADKFAGNSSDHSAGDIADRFDRHFTVVFADTDTIARYGPLPLDRSIIARSIDALAEAGARGIVLKFFLDRDRDEDGDLALARALAGLPVILQARIDDAEQDPNELPPRFSVALQTDTSIQGDSGWIPVARFSGSAHDICFADYHGLPLPMLETYRGRTVKTLPLCAVELAVGSKAVIEPGKHVQIGDITHELDDLGRVALKPDPQPELDYIPLHDLLDDNGDWANRVAGKVVILGYDGPQIHSIQTSIGNISAHRYFVYVLRALLEGDRR